ncbi:MAG: helicase-exonuclease AddAB subunit AddA [Lachnospiraceae bacterium]|nr:helicase-exonuclease AddAB subunit AddA [Lachnospiraceae bacterium]
MGLTENQKLAIDIRDCNVLVSAAAGSGKTSVLVARILNRIISDEQADIDRMLIMTFTKAAAAELRSRIRDAIEDEIKRLVNEAVPDTEKIEHLRKQGMLAGNALITTIHGFCKNVINDHFEKVSLDPNFRVADENECKLMMQDALDRCMENAYEKADPAFLEAVECFSKAKNDKGLAELIIPIYRFVIASPDPAGYLEECRESYNIGSYEEFERSPLFESYVNHIIRKITGLKHITQQAFSIIDENSVIEPYRECISAYDEEIDAILKNTGYEALRERLRTVGNPSFKSIRSKDLDETGEKAKKAVTGLRDEIKNTIGELKELTAFAPKTLYEHIQIAKVPLFAVTDLVADFAAIFEEMKRQQNVIDFNDMEHMAVKILQDPDIAEIYRQQFIEIYVDEYQDSNMTQEVLVSLICRHDPGNVFQVGDVKQSIYSFRHARPDLFLSKYTTYSDEPGPDRRILLNDNFRSRKEVINAVNEVFSAIMKEEAGGIEYDEAARLNHGATFYEDSPKEDPYRTEIVIGLADELSSEELAANIAANRIQDMIRSGYRIYDKAKKIIRPVSYRDFAILVRSMKKYDQAFRDVFAGAGIPLFVTGREGYFGTVEVQTVLAFLASVDNPLCDIELATLAGGPVGGLSDEDMAVITSEAGKDKCLYDRIRFAAEASADITIQEKCRRMLDLLNRYKVMSTYTPVSGIISDFIDRYYGDFVRCMGKQEQRMANLALLLSKAEDYGRTSFKGLYGFVRYMDQIRKYEIDDGEAGVVGENDDVVRLMTMHASKGLEFPVCFVAGLEKKRNTQDESGKIIWNTKLGFGADFVDTNRRITGSTIPKMIAGEENRRDSVAEEIRVLYVAMTRAREKLIMIGVGREDVFEGPTADIEKSMTYFDMIKHAYKNDGFTHIDVSTVTETDLVQGRFAEEMEKEGSSDRILALLRQEEADIQSDKGEVKDVPPYLAHVQEEYPYPLNPELRMKLSVSELKHRAIEEKRSRGEALTDNDEPLFGETEPDKYIPIFARQEGQTATGGTFYGTAFHRIMELWEYASEDVTSDEVMSFAGKMHDSHRMDSDQVSAIRPDDVAFFLNSPLGQQMRTAKEAGRLFREQPFVIGVEESKEMILVQGIVDAYFIDDDGITVVDYKTDRVDHEDVLVNRYREQLEYYGKALAQITGRNIKDLVIYSTRLRKSISVA